MFSEEKTMIHKILFTLAPIAMAANLLADAARHDGGEFEYYEDNDNGDIVITGHANPVGHIEIPSHIDGKPVTGIGMNAFNDCADITSVTIPNSVTSIGDLAFYGCSGLTSVTIPGSVTRIGSYVFGDADRLAVIEFLGAPPKTLYCACGGCGWAFSGVPETVVAYYIPEYRQEWEDIIDDDGVWREAVIFSPEEGPGEAAFARADPFFSKVQTLFVREGEVAKIYVSRLNASDGAVTVKVNAAGGQVEIDGAATDLIEWANHDSADREVTVKGLAAGKSATLTLASPTGGLTLSKTQAKVTVTAVAVDGPVFQTPEASETLTQYVSTSNLYKLVSAPAGKVTFTAVSGKLPAGLKATYNAAENAMAVWGVPTKPGAYEVVFQAKDGSKAGLTQKIAFKVINPLTGDEAEGVPGNGSIAKSRTLKDLMVIDKSAKRLRGVVQITIPTKGNLSAKYQSAVGAVSLSTRSWSAFDVESGALEATLTAKGGYEMNVCVTADGAVAAEISKDGALVGAVESNGQLWSASNTATAWQGYYTALLRNRHDVVEGTAGIAPTGTPYLTFDMSSAGASKTGTMKWAGVLPNGTAVSGSVLLTADGEFAYAPFFKQSKTDVFSGVAKIQKNAFGKIRACVFAHDDVEPAWEHIEKNEAASFAAAYDLAGAYYDKTYDNLLVCCLETYQGAQTHQGETFELDFSVDGAAVKTMVVQPATIKLKAGDNPSRLTFTFNDKTGLISGSVVSAAAGKACQYKGVVVLGLGGIDCGCGEVPEEGLLPFAAGSYYYSDKLQVGTTSLSIKRGGGIDIDAQQ